MRDDGDYVRSLMLWWTRVAGVLLGVAGGIGAIPTDSGGYRRAAEAIVIFVLALEVSWPAPIAVLTTRTVRKVVLWLLLVTVIVAAAVFAVVGPPGLTALMLVLLTGCAVAAFLATTDPYTAFRTLGGAAVIGGGIAAGGAGIGRLFAGEVPLGVALTGAGIAAIAATIADLVKGGWFAVAAAICGGGAAIVAGSVNLITGDHLTGVVLICGGVAALGLAVAERGDTPARTKPVAIRPAVSRGSAESPSNASSPLP
jgi:hypothetical protein